MGDLNKRRGVIQANEAEGDDAVLGATVPLAEMFGYSTALRSMTQVPPGCLLQWCKLLTGPATHSSTRISVARRSWRSCRTELTDESLNQQRAQQPARTRKLVATADAVGAEGRVTV
jgi:Elongation factor G C-terminus